jgi:UDP-N-acetylglucosamine--N-acetylmuramyl-(pentapeptide) pyrophosphoryl-undecaprenol N-acetylglucosamine transferase
MAEKYAEKVFVAFEAGKKHFKDQNKLVVVGNPVRKEFLTASITDFRVKLGIGENEFVLLCFGGSLGAKKINEAFTAILKELNDQGDIRVFYITGAYYYDEVIKNLELQGMHPGAGVTGETLNRGIEEGSEQLNPASVGQGSGRINQIIIFGERICVMEYSSSIHEYMSCADLIISRSGALTISEITVCGKASILIPSPNVTGNHQYYNAKTLSDRGGAYLLTEEDLNSMKLLDIILRLKNNKRLINDMSQASGRLGRLDAADIIYDNICEGRMGSGNE